MTVFLYWGVKGEKGAYLFFEVCFLFLGFRMFFLFVVVNFIVF